MLTRVRDALRARRPPAAARGDRRQRARLRVQPVGRPRRHAGCAATACHRPGAARSPHWRATAAALGFAVAAVPMSQGTPFANVLLVRDLEHAARAMKPRRRHRLHAGHVRSAAAAPPRSPRCVTAQRAAPGNASRPRPRHLVGEVDGVDDVRAAAGAGATSTAATTGWPSSACAGRLRRAGATRARSARAPRRVGVFLGTSTSGILQTELAYRRRDADGALPAGLHYARDARTPSRWRASCAPRSGSQGPRWVVSTACSSSAKAFAAAARLIAPGVDRCRGGRRRRHAVPDDAVRLQFAGAALAPRSAGPGTRGATASRSARRRRSRCSSATATRRCSAGCSAPARAATATT